MTPELNSLRAKVIHKIAALDVQRHSCIEQDQPMSVHIISVRLKDCRQILEWIDQEGIK